MAQQERLIKEIEAKCLRLEQQRLIKEAEAECLRLEQQRIIKEAEVEWLRFEHEEAEADARPGQEGGEIDEDNDTPPAATQDGQDRYNQNFQFSSICKENPAFFLSLDAYGLERRGPSEFTLAPGGSGRHRNGQLPRQAALSSETVSEAASSHFRHPSENIATAETNEIQVKSALP